MNFFESRYYWLNRKLLLLIGQWPYQNHATKIQRNITIVLIVLSLSVVQIAKLVTSEINLDLCCDIFSIQVIILICLTKYITYSVNSGKVKALLEVIKNYWNSLNDCIENKIAQDTAEEAVSIVIFAGVVPPILDIIAPINGSHPKTQIISAEYFVNEEKYFYPILMYTAVISVTVLTILIASDSLYVTCLYHASAMLNVVSYRLEHAFDKYIDANESEEEIKRHTHSRIVNAVEGHKHATEYIDNITDTYGTSHFIAVMFAMLNISISMYCMVVSWQRGSISVTSITITVSQIIHVLIMNFPSQKILDSSALIAFKAYSGTWYLASSRMQALLMPILVRSMKPNIVVIGKLISQTLETACAILQNSLSYCMVLLSFA